MPSRRRDIVVIGTSAGGLEALDELVGQLPTDFAASVFVVQHMSPQSSAEALLGRLSKHRAFRCKIAVSNELFRAATIYIARPDYHLLVKKRTLLVTKGARENRYRPGIDPLFRSAAVTHGPRVIGVVLTGMLDDGTAGLRAIKSCGGVTVVQDPDDATYREMPLSAINNAQVDHCVPLAEMGRLLETLVHGPSGRAVDPPEHVRIEAEIAERVLSDVGEVNRLGNQVPYNCPNCGGVLWQVHKAGVQRYRCHTGHSFTDAALLTIQSEKIEETLWTALRMFEERKNLLNNMALRQKGSTANPYAARAKETQVHIERVRAMLQAPQAGGAARIAKGAREAARTTKGSRPAAPQRRRMIA
jgi:two-component system chemotaxis response regulator CheB